MAHEMRDAVFGLWTGWPIEDQRFDSSAGPASDPDLGEVADVIGVQMGGKICRDVLMRNLKRGEIYLRSRPEIHDELVAVTELDQPGAICLGATYERSAGPERNNTHLGGR